MEQEIKSDAKEIITRLARLQKDIDYVKEHVEDIALTKGDLEAIEDAEKDLKEGKTIPLEDLKKELNI